MFLYFEILIGLLKLIIKNYIYIYIYIYLKDICKTVVFIENVVYVSKYRENVFGFDSWVFWVRVNS